MDGVYFCAVCETDVFEVIPRLAQKPDVDQNFMLILIRRCGYLTLSLAQVQDQIGSH